MLGQWRYANSHSPHQLESVLGKDGDAQSG